jgi:hypothetical protein
MFYNRPKVNFQEKELFKYRFKRDPKSWTLEQIQDLWFRTNQRSKERQKLVSNVYDKIINEIPENSMGYKVVYYHDGKDVIKYEFRFNHQFKSWGYSYSIVEFSKDKSKARDEKIELLLSNDRAFELGKEWKDIQKYRSKYHFRIANIFTSLIEDKLKEKYKGKFPPDITVVKVGDKKYYFAVDDQHRYDYLKFYFKGEVLDNIIEL